VPDVVAIQNGFMRVFWGLLEGLLNVRQAELFLRALHKAAAGEPDIPATGDFAVTSNERQRQHVAPAKAGSEMKIDLSARLKSCPDTKQTKFIGATESCLTRTLGTKD